MCMNHCGWRECCCRHTCYGCCWDEDDEITPFPEFPITRFPVYVSYPSFYAGETALTGANEALFASNGNNGNGSGRRCRG